MRMILMLALLMCLGGCYVGAGVGPDHAYGRGSWHH